MKFKMHDVTMVDEETGEAVLQRAFLGEGSSPEFLGACCELMARVGVLGALSKARKPQGKRWKARDVAESVFRSQR